MTPHEPHTSNRPRSRLAWVGVFGAVVSIALAVLGARLALSGPEPLRPQGQASAWLAGLAVVEVQSTHGTLRVPFGQGAQPSLPRAEAYTIRFASPSEVVGLAYWWTEQGAVPLVQDTSWALTDDAVPPPPEAQHLVVVATLEAAASAEVVVEAIGDGHLGLDTPVGDVAIVVFTLTGTEVP